MKQFVLGLPPELVDALEHLAGRDEEAIGEILRDALRNDLRRRTRARSEKLARALAPIRTRLADDLDAARDWYDLQDRLRQHGYHFVRCGGGLSLQDADGQHICNGAELGHSHAQLTRRFGRPMPQPAEHLALAS